MVLRKIIPHCHDLFSITAGSVRNIRVGITEAYVEFVRELGTEWLEKNLSGFLIKVLDIVSQPKVFIVITVA